MGFTSTGGGNIIDNDTIKKNASNEIYVDDSSLPVNSEVIEHELEIIELQANASMTPFDHDSYKSDTFSDADGYRNSVDTGNTTGEHSTNKYIRGNSTEAHGRTFDTTSSVTHKEGWKILMKSAGTLTKITKTTSCTATKAWIYTDAAGALLDSAAFVGNVATFSEALSDATSYYIVVDNDGGAYNRHFENAFSGYPISGTIVDWTKRVHNSGAWTESESDAQCIESVEFTSDADKLIRINLGSITGSVTHTQLIVNDPDRETGDEIIYTLRDSAAAVDTDLALDTKNALVNCDPTKITSGSIDIHLNGKATTPTAGVPSCKSYVLKVWVA